MRSARPEAAFLLLLFVVGLALRLPRASAIGLSEDEATKYFAIDEYRRGNFAGVNSEHPSLMKLLSWVSLDLGERWNAAVASESRLILSDETLLRVPNLVAGAATGPVIYLFAREMLGPVGAGAAAYFWTVSPMVLAINAIVKEDTLATLFGFLGMWLFRRGKTSVEARLSRRWFWSSGAAFGLALASKYYFHILGATFLITHFAGRKLLNRCPFAWPYRVRFWTGMAATFLLLNPWVPTPVHVRQLLAYVAESTVAHHGYVLNGTLYLNNASAVTAALPWYFYGWAIAVKTQLPALAALVVGLLAIRTPSALLTRIVLGVFVAVWLIPFSVVAGKSLRYLLTMLPVLFIVAGFGIERVYQWVASPGSNTVRRAAFAVSVLLLVVVPAVEAHGWSPWYRLYLNQIGTTTVEVGALFAPDEVYDLGLREAVTAICRTAGENGAVASSAPTAVRYYLMKCNRTDVSSLPLFDPHLRLHSGDHAVLQSSRRYVETETASARIAEEGDLVDREGLWTSLVVAEVYRLRLPLEF